MKKNVKTEKKREEQTRRRQEKVLDSLTGTIDGVEAALRKNEIELAEEIEEEEEDAPEEFDPALPTVRKRKSLFAAGVFIIIMTVVGIISTVRFVMELAGDIANRTALKEELAQYIYPLVITDVPAFDAPANTPNSVVITSAIWNIILNGDTDKYEKNGGDMTVSEIDVESSAASLYGYGLTLTHETVRLGDITFTYNQTNRSYTVAERPRVNSYYPVVTEVSAVGELYTMTVEYHSPTVFTLNGEERQAEKTMIYTVSRTGTSTTVQSVEYHSAAEQEG